MWPAAGISLLDMDSLRDADLVRVEQAAKQYEEVMRDGS